MHEVQENNGDEGREGDYYEEQDEGNERDLPEVRYQDVQDYWKGLISLYPFAIIFLFSSIFIFFYILWCINRCV